MIIMNLWLSSLLFASLLLSGSALTPEECQPLVSPISLADPSVIHGKWNFLAGYTDHDFHRSMLRLIDSSSGNIMESPADNTQLLINQTNRMNGTCMKSTMKMNIEGNTLTSLYLNMTVKHHLLPSSDGFLVFLMNSTGTNVKNVLQLLKISHADVPNELSSRSLYIFGGGQTLAEADLEHFKKQASCFGFSGEPDFLYNPEKGFCTEDESIQLPNFQ